MLPGIFFRVHPDCTDLAWALENMHRTEDEGHAQLTVQ
jgi:hypothetical protein